METFMHEVKGRKNGSTVAAGSPAKTPLVARAPLRYEAVVKRITDLIDGGTYGPGDRLPSVRQLGRQMGVSLSTVMEAYRRLENAGRIEARPQSGYYVQQGAGGPKLDLPAHIPDLSHLLFDPTPVSTLKLTHRVMRHLHDPALVPLGAMVPNPAFLPLDKLNRAMTHAMREAGTQGHLYDPPPGCEALRVQVARRLVLAGCALTPDQIVTTTGCQEALCLCLHALCRPGDTVVIPTPIYHGILQAIEMQGLKALEIPAHPQTGICLEALGQALDHTEVRACLVIANHSNPTGGVMPDDHKRRLVEMLAARGVPLIEDDIYGDLGYGPVRPRVAKAWDTEGNVLLCSSFSKTLSPGYRVGWVAPGRWQAQVEWQKAVANLATPLPTQLAVAHFLASGGYDYHLRRIRRIYARQTTLMGQAIMHYFPAGTKVTPSLGGFGRWVELPPEFDSLWLFEQALAIGISIAPGPMFSASRRYGHCVRLNTAFWSPQVEGALEKLGTLLKGKRN